MPSDQPTCVDHTSIGCAHQAPTEREVAACREPPRERRRSLEVGEEDGCGPSCCSSHALHLSEVVQIELEEHRAHRRHAQRGLCDQHRAGHLPARVPRAQREEVDSKRSTQAHRLDHAAVPDPIVGLEIVDQVMEHCCGRGTHRIAVAACVVEQQPATGREEPPLQLVGVRAERPRVAGGDLLLTEEGLADRLVDELATTEAVPEVIRDVRQIPAAIDDPCPVAGVTHGRGELGEGRVRRQRVRLLSALHVVTLCFDVRCLTHGDGAAPRRPPGPFLLIPDRPAIVASSMA